MMARATASVVAALVIIGVVAAAAVAAPTPVIGQSWAIALNDSGRGFGATLQNDCIAPQSRALVPGRSTKLLAKTTFLAGGVDHVSGSYDAESRAGTTTSHGPALALAGDWFGRRGARHQPGVTINDLGLQFVNGRAYVTGTLRSSRTLTAATPRRRRLALIAHPELTSGPAFVNGMKITQSLVFAIAGNATVQPALANAISRLRCPRSHTYPHSHRVRASSALGQIEVTMVPGAAVGTAGTVKFSPDVLERCGTDDCATVSITPTGEATADNEGGISFPLASGTAATLVCDQQAKCQSQAGRLSLTGGFSLGLGGAASNATDLTFTYAGIYNGAPESTQSAELDGLLEVSEVQMTRP